MKDQHRVLCERALGWSYDLPHVEEAPLPLFGAERISPPPNHYDEIYLELSRATISLRGLGVLLGGAALILGGVMKLFLFWLMFFNDWQGDWITKVFLLLCLPAVVWALLPYVKLDLVLPRDEPIRFNRLRRKIYIYQYRFHRFFVFSRKHWGVKPVAYNWEDVTAEVYRVYVPGHGGLIENVMLSIRNPETKEVIDRVFFTHDLYRGETYWAIARLFMQQGPEALPKFVHPPRDWNDDDGLSHMHCLAPKVHWPEDIDCESRTAPSGPSGSSCTAPTK
ncbi:DUF6708 domain-containing protein [Pseudomonas sp. SMV7]|uniref:DUF6708 domain-containing protein n=1 Tax=Pseudomonas sp. SMV7 TaxID=3390194 RepID=UPI003F860FA3